MYEQRTQSIYIKNEINLHRYKGNMLLYNLRHEMNKDFRKTKHEYYKSQILKPKGRPYSNK